MTAACATMGIVDALGVRIHGALVAWCTVPAFCAGEATSVSRVSQPAALDVDSFVVAMFRDHGVHLLRLARLFVDDLTAAEDLVQEAFIRLARTAHRIDDVDRAPAYLRSIVVNLARDHNRRGLVSMRHRLPLTQPGRNTDEEVMVREDQREVIEALRDLPDRQRVCLVLRYYDELGIDDIAATMGISRNSVKTHLQRGLAALERCLGPSETR